MEFICIYMKGKIMGVIFIFISIILSLANIFSVKITGAIIGVSIESSFLTILTFVFFFLGLIFLSKIGKGLAALVITGAGVYAGHKLYHPAQDYSSVSKKQIESVKITAPYSSEQGKFERTYRYDVILDIVEGKYNLPKGILKGLGMRESGGDPLKLNGSGDGGGGFFMFSPGTAEAYGMDVYGYSKKTGVDKKHGAELKILVKKNRLDYQKMSEIDERFNVEKSADAAGKYLRDLYNRYKSWDKALSAYNQGHPAPEPDTTKHVKAVKRYQQTYNKQDKKDYYKLYKRGKIRKVPI
jgi:hypothetical protein